MSTDYAIQIADAIVSELNAAARAWTLPFRAERRWLPVYIGQEGADASEFGLNTVRVSVVPAEIATEEKIDRRPLEKVEYTLDVGIEARVSIADLSSTADMDALSAQAQDVHDFYRDGHHLATLTAWKVMKARREMIYDLPTLYTQGVWVTAVQLTVQGYR